MIIALVLRLGQRDPVDDDVGGGGRRSVVSRLIKSISSASCPGQHHKLTYCRITNVNSDFRKEALNFTKDEVKQEENVEKQKVSLMKVEEWIVCICTPQDLEVAASSTIWCQTG